MERLEMERMMDPEKVAQRNQRLAIKNKIGEAAAAEEDAQQQVLRLPAAINAVVDEH